MSRERFGFAETEDLIVRGLARAREEEYDHGFDPWKPLISLSTSDSASQSRGFFTLAECRQLHDAAPEYGSIPGYNDLSLDARDRWLASLAQRFEKRNTRWNGTYRRRRYQPTGFVGRLPYRYPR